MSDSTKDLIVTQARRDLLAGIAISAGGLSATLSTLAGATSTSAPSASATPSTEKTPPRPPGKPGDFNFLEGKWKIANRQLKKFGGTEWDTFPGEATCWTILGGICSIEELRIPAKNFSGMAVRILDVEKKAWADHWVNAKSGVLGAPGAPGYFENGEAIFDTGAWEDKGQKYLSRGIWDRFTPASCRWRQASSKDNGKTWDENWIMEWTRA